jgi:starvation-inducible DNA-binding protein
LTRRGAGGKSVHQLEIKMTMKTARAAGTKSDTGLSDSLNQVLADSYALLSLTHLAHWNVEGPGFFALHTAFQTQYEELFIAIDEIAERIRALGAYAIGGLGKFAEAARMREFVSPLPQEDYVRGLITANEKLVADAMRARDLAGEANDPESQDLMIGRITLHQKSIWMLKSFLKG